ncbi:Na(+)/H(+) antiporter subunit D [Desulfotalea psychrophila]|uniref:Probable NADH dehydrogenase, subunit 5 n=1 Tax=Desulfotalea psychrophila (strain LSv54 / DSM 12343) TaxID=177439 RepID=Q6ANN3_DESPS|nr:Na(+)/H(+) antiporter subunit D [Desulfotalea psychrophila]CAG36041.1 probable NADH dehydrogenase, subunit 5 [Desulfotalea psychrophila LSv54]
MTNAFIHPALIMICGAIILPLIPAALKKAYLLLVPVLTFIDVLYINGSHGTYGVISFMGEWTLTFGRVDNLSTVFAFIMALMAIIGTLYSLHIKGVWQHVAAWFYVAGSLGAIYAADYLVLFLFWEMMAFASTFLIWFNKDKGALAAGFRYLLVHTFGGVILLLGFLLRYQATGDISFIHLSETGTQLYTWLILVGLMLNAAVVPFHSWLPDAYSKSTITGGVFLCAFTTKTAVYTLARAFAGFDILIGLGVIMAVYGIIYALKENDIRRLLGWEIVSQVGYMVVGVGIGTALAINGTVAHAVAHILYKGLLFMAAGAVIQATGTSKLTELGGLYKKMPATMLFLLVGGVSVSAFPLFSGFVSKSMIIAASYESHILWAGFLLTMVSVGTFLAAGLRLPWLIFFSPNKNSAGSPLQKKFTEAKDPSWNMYLAMSVAGILCFIIGTFPTYLYQMLPNSGVEFHPYTAYHLSETLQLLVFGGIAFYFLRKKLLPEDVILLDMDWFYRKGAQVFLWCAQNPFQWCDTIWGKAYRVVGLNLLMVTAKFWSWFDWNVIDRLIDGSACGVRSTGRRLSIWLQRGQIQQTICITVTLLAIFIVLSL